MHRHGCGTCLRSAMGQSVNSDLTEGEDYHAWSYCVPSELKASPDLKETAIGSLDVFLPCPVGPRSSIQPWTSWLNWSGFGHEFSAVRIFSTDTHMTEEGLLPLLSTMREEYPKSIHKEIFKHRHLFNLTPEINTWGEEKCFRFRSVVRALHGYLDYYYLRVILDHPIYPGHLVLTGGGSSLEEIPYAKNLRIPRSRVIREFRLCLGEICPVIAYRWDDLKNVDRKT